MEQRSFWTLFLLLLSSAAFLEVHSIEIYSRERDPSCNPIQENQLVSLKVVTSSVWDTCVWYRSQTSQSELDPGIIVCKQFTENDDEGRLICDEDKNSTRSTSLGGGLKASKKTCELLITGTDRMDTGFWNVKVTKEGNTSFSSFEVVSNQQEKLSIQHDGTGIVNGHLDQRVVLICNSRNGLPRTSKFNWRIDDNEDFYREWSAILYPIDFSDDGNVTQTLDLIPPRTGSFLVACKSDQNGFYSTDANITLNVGQSLDDSSTKLSQDWIIVIAVSCSIIFLLIVVTIIAFCCGMCCFSSKKIKKDTTKKKDSPADNSGKNMDVADKRAEDKTKIIQPRDQRPNVDNRPYVSQPYNNNNNYNYNNGRGNVYYSNDRATNNIPISSQRRQNEANYARPSAPRRPPHAPASMSSDDGVLV